MTALLTGSLAAASHHEPLTITVEPKDNESASGQWLPRYIPGTIPTPSQRQIRKARRRRWAAGDRKAFN